MKIGEVPQDRGIMPEDLHEICYAVDGSGNYVLVDSAGWGPKNAVNKQAWEIIRMQAADALKDIHAGRQSPLAFHMAVNQMNAGLLSRYVRMNRWRVKRHLKPDVFKCLRPEILRRYADVFEITVAELQQVPSEVPEGFQEYKHVCR